MQGTTEVQKIWETEKDRELEYLRGKVAAYETALRLLAGKRGIEPTMAVVK